MHWAAHPDQQSRAKLAGVIAARDPGLVHAKDGGGRTPLHHAAMCVSEAVARVLLAAGADKDEKEFMTGDTPLHIAAQRGSEGLARALLAAGANKAAKDNAGVTPLHVAQQQGHAALVALLS